MANYTGVASHAWLTRRWYKLMHNSETNQESVLEPSLSNVCSAGEKIQQFHPNDNYVFPKKLVGQY